jgi:DNA segregation ATPase FtsK/SpoIIIE-like protein
LILPYLIIVIDELFHLVLTRKKQTGLYFLQLLIVGHEVNMHVIAASESTYRNLLIQLVHLHPSIEQQLTTKKLIGSRTIIKPLGAEMVITPYNLIFFKTIDMSIYERYFPI